MALFLFLRGTRAKGPAKGTGTMKWIRGALVGIAALAMVSCGGESSTRDEDRPRVALVMKSLANEFFQTMEQGAREHHEERSGDFDLIVNGIRNEEDVGRQVELVEQMMAQGVDAIVIAPADSKALVGVLQRAATEGIVVVNIDNKLDAAVLAERGLSIPFVGPDNEQGARLAGDFLGERLEIGSQVAIIGGIPTAFNAIQRRAGFESAMRNAEMEIVSNQSANWEMSKANQVASGILSEYPGLKAILCANDSMALGVVAAVKEAGRNREVMIVGFDNISAVQDLIRGGQVLCTIDQHGDRLAVYGIQYALEMLETGATPEDRGTSVDLITAETLSGSSN